MNIYTLTEEQLAEMIEFEKMCELEARQEAWDELQAVPSYVERLHPGVALVVVMLDELVHTDEHPCCDDNSCPCHVEVQ